MKLELDEEELRRARLESMAIACDAFFSWLSAHSDAQFLLQGVAWEFYQTQFLEGLKQVTRQKRDQMFPTIRGR